MTDRKCALLALRRCKANLKKIQSVLTVSKRSLQRQLSDESTSFMDILNATRQQLAQRYLSIASVSQGEIAYLLGFQEVNSFIRAFKDWTGNTPGAYRHDMAKTTH